MGVTLVVDDAGTRATVVTEAGGEPVTLSLHDASQSVTAQAAAEQAALAAALSAA
jgi:hypothetical protein